MINYNQPTENKVNEIIINLRLNKCKVEEYGKEKI